MEEILVHPDKVVVVTVTTYRTKTWMEVLSRLVRERKSGQVILHMGNGRIECMDWKEYGR